MTKGKMLPRHLVPVIIALLPAACMLEPEDHSPSGNPAMMSNRSLPVINEIHFDPEQGSIASITDQPDFVEIYNPGTNPIDLTGWSITDRPTAAGKVNQYKFAPDGYPNTLLPGQYAVITPENTADFPNSRLKKFYRFLDTLTNVKVFIVKKYKVFSLNNDNDLLRLLDRSGAVVDSVDYISSWHNPFLKSTKGISIEKYHPLMESNRSSSWSSCSETVYGATPCKVNSIYVNPGRSLEQLGVSPNPFSPDGDGRDDILTIRVNLPAGAYQMSVKLYNLTGREVRTLANGTAAGPTSYFEWNGLDEGRSPLPAGQYLIKVEAGTASGERYRAEKTIVLAR